MISSSLSSLALPYPGCEFFTEYKENHHSGLNLYFNWQQSFISSDLLLSNPSPMIPDEMLSCNGRIISPALGKRSQAQIDEDRAPWFEFQHDIHHHYALNEEIKKQLAAVTSTSTSIVTSDSQPASPAPSSSSSPPVTTVIADHIVDQLLTHSSSSHDTSVMASTVPRDDTVAVGVTSSDAKSASSEVATIAAAATPLAPVQQSSSSIAPHSKHSSSSSSSAQQSHPITSFSLYKSWDVITLTKNYLLILLAHIADEGPNSGLLVHCISGWDRSPPPPPPHSAPSQSHNNTIQCRSYLTLTNS